MNIILPPVTFFHFYSTFRQTSVKGLIVDREGLGGSLVSISIEKTTLGIYSDEDGNSFARHFSGEHVVIISVVGYRQWSRSYRLPKANTSGRVEIEEDVLVGVVSLTMKRTFLKDSPIKVEVITGKILDGQIVPGQFGRKHRHGQRGRRGRRMRGLRHYQPRINGLKRLIPRF
ncbi:MAG: hypothetical protein R2825_13740 [Saprospiraceae bacterium]